MLQLSERDTLTNNSSVPCVVYVDHIPSIDDQQLVKSVVPLQEYFNHSRIYQSAKQVEETSHRNSLSLNSEQKKCLHPLISSLSAEVNKRHAAICRVLELPGFTESRSYSNCLAYGDGSFFLRHSDFTSVTLYPRRLTWIYYFFKEPQSFTGGQLIFYKNDEEVARITPRSGMLVAFRADTVHEATLVSLKSQNFEDYRFAITCFVAGTPTLRSIMCAIRYKVENEFPWTRKVTRPLIGGARRARKWALSLSKNL